MNNSKIFLSVLGLLAGGCAFSASALAADSEAVLFKIHDVQPIKGTDNQTTACDYNVTFYNRSQKDLSSASLLLTWTDSTIDTVILDEKNKDAREGRQGFNQTIANMEANSPVQVSSQLEVPALAPNKQVSVRARIQSDRCFLLTGPVDVQVKTCNINGGANTTSRSRYAANSGGTSCDGLFTFVSPENPEYYREFKPISYDDEKIQAEARRNQERTDINTQYDAVVNEISKISTVLEGIKSDVPLAPVKKPKPAVSEAEAEQLTDKLQSLFPNAEVPAPAEAPAAPAEEAANPPAAENAPAADTAAK